MGSPFQVLSADTLCHAQSTLADQLDRLVQQWIELFISHGMAIGLGCAEIIAFCSPHLVEVTPDRWHLWIQGDGPLHCPARLAEAAQLLQRQPQFMVRDLHRRIHAEDSAQQRHSPGFIT